MSPLFFLKLVMRTSQRTPRMYTFSGVRHTSYMHTHTSYLHMIRGTFDSVSYVRAACSCCMFKSPVHKCVLRSGEARDMENVRVTIQKFLRLWRHISPLTTIFPHTSPESKNHMHSYQLSEKKSGVFRLG